MKAVKVILGMALVMVIVYAVTGLALSLFLNYMAGG